MANKIVCWFIGKDMTGFDTFTTKLKTEFGSWQDMVDVNALEKEGRAAWKNTRRAKYEKEFRIEFYEQTPEGNSLKKRVYYIN
jgi:hypothetical protein